VDDETNVRESCRQILQDAGFHVLTARRAGEGLEVIRARKPDIVLADVRLPDMDGLSLLRAAHERDPETLFILITGFASVDASLEAIRSGAYDYLPKPFSAVQLQVLVGRAAKQVELARENRRLRERVRGEGLPEMVASSPAMQDVLTLIRRVAATDASVFISGESGTGKELVARAVHAKSRRSEHRFLAVNCAALPASLLESELFGHEKGAFTGAATRKEGLLEHASGGTFFLDEVSEMPLELQAKLLRVIQDRRIRRVGGHQEMPVDIRFVAATNRDPARAVEDGGLRKDLFFRLNVVPVRLPPLRDRISDIPVLLQHFLAHFGRLYHGPRLPPLRLSPGAASALRSYHWPGNVRELQNLAERLVSLTEPGEELGIHELPPEILSGPVPDRRRGAPPPQNFHEARDRALASFERGYLRELLGRHRWNISAAAREAGVDRKTIHRMLKRNGLDEGGGGSAVAAGGEAG